MTQTTIPFSKLIAPDAINARAASKRGLDDLAASIKLHGLIQPLAVRPADGSDKYEVIDGRRRLQAMAQLVKGKASGWTKATAVPVIIRNEDDAAALGLSLIANTCREDMHPVDQHEAVARLSEQGLSDADIAARLAVSERTVRQHRALGALAPERILTEPLRRRKPTRYFVNSMSDLFHESVPDEWIDRVFAVMALCPQHTFQVLTKRSARMLAYMTRGDDEHGDYFERLSDAAVALTDSPCAAHVDSVDWPLPNVWLGVSTERQQEADARIPDLLATPAAVRFVSAEPLLGPIDFTQLNWRDGLRLDALQSYTSVPTETPGHWLHEPNDLPALDWIIVGGESGTNARPMHPDWPRSIRDQCVAAGTAFFFKQWGEHAWTPDQVAYTDAPAWGRKQGFPIGTPFEHHSCGHTSFRVGKKRAGRLLDGRTWGEMPATAAQRQAEKETA